MSLFPFCNLGYENYMNICHYSTKIIRFNLSMKMDKRLFKPSARSAFFVPSFAIIKTSKLGLHTDPVSMPPRNKTREFES